MTTTRRPTKEKRMNGFLKVCSVRDDDGRNRERSKVADEEMMLLWESPFCGCDFQLRNLGIQRVLTAWSASISVRVAWRRARGGGVGEWALINELHPNRFERVFCILGMDKLLIMPSLCACCAIQESQFFWGRNPWKRDSRGGIRNDMSGKKRRFKERLRSLRIETHAGNWRLDVDAAVVVEKCRRKQSLGWRMKRNPGVEDGEESALPQASASSSKSSRQLLILLSSTPRKLYRQQEDERGHDDVRLDGWYIPTDVCMGCPSSIACGATRSRGGMGWRWKWEDKMETNSILQEQRTLNPYTGSV